MEIRQLKYFQAVSSFKKITLASEHLHVSQPSITVAIQKLEEELGVLLFDRSQKQMTLTEEGRIFLHNTEHILLSLKNAVLEMQDLKSTPKGTIKIGIPPMIGAYLFPPLFTSFKKAYPLINLSIVECGSLTIKKLLEDGKIDLAIFETSYQPSSLTSLPLLVGEILVCLPKEHPLSSRPSIDFKELKDEGMILFSEGTYHRQVILNECERNDFSPRIILTTSQLETIRRLVSVGAGISFLFDFLVKNGNEIATRRLFSPIILKYGLGWRTETYLPRPTKIFIDFVTSEINSAIHL